MVLIKILYVDKHIPEDLSHFDGLWQSFVTIGSCNHLMRIIELFQRMSATQRKVRSLEDDDYSKTRQSSMGCKKLTIFLA